MEVVVIVLHLVVVVVLVVPAAPLPTRHHIHEHTPRLFPNLIDKTNHQRHYHFVNHLG